MIARDAEPQSLQLNSSIVDFQTTSFGDELPSVSCDLADLNISANDFEQIVQSIRDIPLSVDGFLMDCDESALMTTIPPAAHSSCEITTMIFDETKRTCIPDPHASQEASDLDLISFFQTLSDVQVRVPPVSRRQGGGVTPPYSGGSTPHSQSRATSPAWSESSGNMSTSSMSGPSFPGKSSSHGTHPIPRHKRPSHRRAEVKRRDRIKTCLDDIKGVIPSLQDKGKLSESAVLTKAAEYIHQLKDGFSERGNKAAELRREIECLSGEIHSFQESLPAGGLKDEAVSNRSLDEHYTEWVAEYSRRSPKHYIFTSITSSLFDSFKQVVGDAGTLDSMGHQLKEWQTKYLGLPVLRKQILKGMLNLTRNSDIVVFPKDRDTFSSSVDDGNS